MKLPGMRIFFCIVVFGFWAGALLCSFRSSPARADGGNRIPVILDTDIGTDIDDTWALALLLSLTELDLKLVVTDHGDTEARARVAAKFLQVSGRGDIPVGIGKRIGDSSVPQKEWARDYDLRSHPGGVHEDGVGALVDLIMKSRELITLIVLGPAPNIREALAREPRIVSKARVIAMSGSVDMGYDGNPRPAAEYNVKEDPAATRAMYGAGWEVTIAPLDTAGTIRLAGERYKRILACRKPSIRALIENYRIWAGRVNWTRVNPDERSSVLFDTLAVALTRWPSYCSVEAITLEVADDGFTRRTPGGSRVRAALRWKERDEYEEWLTARLTQ